MFQRVKSAAGHHSRQRWIVPIFPVLLLCITFSCALTTSNQNGADTGKADTEAVKKPSPGDVKIVDGVEFIYGKNVRWPTLPSEPEYVWIRKDQYASRPFDSLGEAFSEQAKDKKEIEDLQKRLDRLEREIKGLDNAPVVAP